MAKSFAQSKGARGERLAIDLLQPIVDRVLGEKSVILARNSMQSRFGGYDVIGLDWMALEIKNCETLNIPTWWNQVIKSCKADQEPILMYKSNRVKFRIMMYGYLPIGLKKLRCPVDIPFDTFACWFEHRLKEEQLKACPQT